MSSSINDKPEIAGDGFSRPKWVTPKLDKNERRSVVAKSNAVASVHLLVRVALQLLAILLAVDFYRGGLWVGAILLTLLSGFMWNFLGWAGLSHELFHGTVFSNKLANRLLFRGFSILSWSNYGYFELSHWLHHRYTRYELDPESKSDDPIARTAVPWLLTIDLPGLVKQVGILLRNAGGFVPQNISRFADARQIRAVRIGAIAVLLVQLVFGAVFLAVGRPELLLLITLGPFTFSLPRRILELVQHKGAEHDVNDFRRNSRTVILPRFLSFLYANMNYHVEHHLMPAVPYYRLPAFRSVLISDGYKRQEDELGLAGAVQLAFAREP
jgi:fatty acid desaturase